MVRRESIDISDIRRRSESNPRIRGVDGISHRVVNGRQGEDLLKMMREEEMPRDGFVVVYDAQRKG